MPHDIVEKFSTHLKNVLTQALCLVVETNGKAIQPEHLLWALGTQKGCLGAEILKKAGVKLLNLKKLAGIKQTASLNFASGDVNLQLSDNAKRIVEKAVLTANAYGHRYVGTEHLLAGILEIEDSHTNSFFQEEQTNIKELRQQLAMVLKSTSKFPDLADSMKVDRGDLMHGPTTAVAEKEGSQPQEKKISAIEYFSVELTSVNVQKKIDPVIGREMEIERVMEILCRRTKNNPLLLGDPGVGKTAIVEGLAKKITQGDIPAVLARKRIFALDLALIVAGTMYRGEFEGRLRQIVEEAKQDPEIILFIDEIHTIVGAGSASGSMDASSILKPALARGEIHCIGATTPGECKKYIESDSALERRFQQVLVDEPDAEKTLQILEGVSPNYEQFHRVRITHDALVAAVKFSERYIQNRQWPDKAIDLIDEAAAASRVRDIRESPVHRERELFETLSQLKNEKRQAVVEERFYDAMEFKTQESRVRNHLDALRLEEHASPIASITHLDVARVVSTSTRVPLEDLLAQHGEELLRLEADLRSHILGQEPVIQTVAGALRRAKTLVAAGNRPLASFLFLGPSGVGKTELAKKMAHTLFHSKHHFIRLDMSEYAENFTMSKLIGAPPGYVGYKDQANLTDRVKQRPYCVVLFDEIEKAHPDVQNLLLQILEEGELTDASGRLVNFKNAIIILTSNVGLERFERGEMGFMSEQNERAQQLTSDLKKELHERFRPELLNRLDHTCIFQQLSDEILCDIARKQLEELKERLYAQGVKITFAKSIAAHIAAHADAHSGARDLRSRIQTDIEHKIAEHLSTAKRPSSLRISLLNGELTITHAR